VAIRVNSVGKFDLNSVGHSGLPIFNCDRPLSEVIIEVDP